MSYLKRKKSSLENSILSVWSEAAKKEGNAFGMALQAAKENGDKKFTVSGKTYDVKTEMDKVNKVALGKKFKDRKDKDIDNDGDVDSSDKYLHKRRKAVSKAIKSETKINEGQISEMKKVEITLNNPNDVKKIKKDVIDLTNKKRKVNITMKQMGKKLIIDGGDYDINREVADIRNFIGYKSAKVVEDIQPKTFSQKVQEQVSAFGRESFLAENNMDVIKSIVKSGGAKDLKMKDGKLKMDSFTASAIAQVYDKVNPTNKKKMEGLANGKKSDLMKLQKLAMKFVK